MIIKCKNCPMHEDCICNPDSDECVVRTEGYDKAIDDFAALLKKMANKSSTYYIRLADYNTNSDLRFYNIDEIAEQLKKEIIWVKKINY